MSDGGEEDIGTVMVPVRSADPLVGQVLKDRYEILAPLGQGGMATVYSAHDSGSGQRVVVKVPRPDLAGELGRDMQILERFELEIGAQAGLEHPHIVRIRDRGKLQLEGMELPFVVVDFKGGGDLDNRLREGRQTGEQILEWLKPIAMALDYSHDRGWIHRDIKPDNILYDELGFVCLSDFGIAKRDTGESAAEEAADNSGPRITKMGYVLGAPGYIPQDALRGEFTPAYDQYSLAVIVAQALSGEAPSREFTTSANDGMLAKIPKSSSVAIRRALSVKSEDRFPNCLAFADALREEIAKPGFSLPALGKTPLIAGAAVALLAVVGLGVWLTTAGGGTELAPNSQPTRSDDPSAVEEEIPSRPLKVEGIATVRDEPTPPKTIPVVPPPPRVGEPRSFSVGSTSAEAQDALQLCRSHLDFGCSAEWYAEEIPPRPVKLAPFELDDREVTVREFAAFAAANPSHRTEAERRGSSFVIIGLANNEVRGLTWREPGWQPKDDEPVVHVGVRDAQAFCAWDGGRLPSADEWEALARGNERLVFPWGNEWDASAARWMNSNSVKRPGSVARFPAAPAGYYDLAGNVWEWTSDRMSDSDGEFGVLKGGSWAELTPSNLRSAGSFAVEIDYSAEDVGFRCARSRQVWPDEAK